MRHLNTIGVDGFFTFFLSNIVMAATAGLSLGLSLFYVLRTARSAPVVPPSGSVLVVLGMRLNNGVISKDYAMRLTRARKIYLNDNKRLIVTVGGITDASDVSEASKGKQYLISYGANPEHILTEDESTHTLENLRNVRSLLKSNNLKKFTLITNRYHLARSLVISEGLGLKPHLCAAENELIVKLDMLPRLLLEAYYVHWYKTGAVWSRMIRNKKSLERIS